MRLHELFEDSRQDLEYRERARDIYHKLITELNRNGLDNFRYNDKGFYIISAIKLGTTEPLRIFIHSKEKSPFYREGRKGGFDKKNVSIHIFVDIDNIIEELSGSGYQSTITHELIHYFDSDVYRAYNAKGSSFEETWEDYFNNDLEFNAYYQEGIDKFEKMLNRIKTVSDRSSSTEDTLQKFLRIMDNYKRFEDLMRRTIFDTDFIKHLNYKNNSKLTKRLYQYYTEHYNEFKDIASNIPKIDE